MSPEFPCNLTWHQAMINKKQRAELNGHRNADLITSGLALLQPEKATGKAPDRCSSRLMKLIICSVDPWIRPERQTGWGTF